MKLKKQTTAILTALLLFTILGVQADEPVWDGN